MHVPDGFLDAPTSVCTAVVAAGAIAMAVRRTRSEGVVNEPPMAALVATLVFALQTVNFHVGDGTSGHLLGGALAAVLVGPWAAAICLTAVLTVQACIFADGGITALGTNVVLMALVGVAVGWFVTRASLTLLPRSNASLPLAAGLGAVLSVPAAAVTFTGLYLVGGATDVGAGELAEAMIGWHALIGLGEGALTAGIVGVLISSRPDLVHASRLVARPEKVVA